MIGAAAYYFSTHGCNFVFSMSLGVGPLEEEAPLVAAAAARALLLKKFDIVACYSLTLRCPEDFVLFEPLPRSSDDAPVREVLTQILHFNPLLV